MESSVSFSTSIETARKYGAYVRSFFEELESTFLPASTASLNRQQVERIINSFDGTLEKSRNDKCAKCNSKVGPNDTYVKKLTDNGRFSIHIPSKYLSNNDEDLPYIRAIFELGHGLLHLISDEYPVGTIMCYTSGGALKLEAAAFAREMIMPKHAFEAVAAKHLSKGCIYNVEGIIVEYKAQNDKEYIIGRGKELRFWR